jgi:signal transduction histidine kinase
VIQGKLTLYLSIVDGTEPQKRAIQDAITNSKKENIFFVGFSDAFQEAIKEDLPSIYQKKFIQKSFNKKKETLHLIFSSATKAIVFNHVYDYQHQKERIKLILQILNAGIDVYVPASLKYFALCSQELQESLNIESSNFLIPSSFFKHISRVILVNNFNDTVHDAINCPVKEFLTIHPEKSIHGRLSNMAFILATHISYHSRDSLTHEKKTTYKHSTSLTLTSFFKRFNQISETTAGFFFNLKIKTFNIASSLLNVIIAFSGTQLLVTNDSDYHKILIVFLTCAITFNLVTYSLLPTFVSIVFSIALNLHTPDFSNPSPDALLRKIGLFIGIFLVYIIIQNKKIIFQQQVELSNKESRFNCLYTYMETLSTATSVEEIFKISENYFRSTFSIDIVLILQNPFTLKTQRIITRAVDTTIEDNSEDSAIKQLSLDQYREYELTQLVSDSVELGLLGMKKNATINPLDAALVSSSVLQITLALQRYNLSQSYQSAVLSSEKEQLRSVILSSISHDLKTPLTTIIGSCTALEELENLSNKNKMILVHAIHEASNQLNQFITNILDSSRLASENILQQTSLVYLDDIINVILHRSKKILRLFEVSVTVTNSEEAVVYGDFTLLQQVFYNIIENATKYVPIGGKISIFVTNIMDKVFVRIYDNGPGIIESKRKLIFDKFYRLQHSDQQKAGTGLGLSICKQIIEAYNGRIWASDRDDKKKGAQFNIELPSAFPHSQSKNIQTRILK